MRPPVRFLIAAIGVVAGLATPAHSAPAEHVLRLAYAADPVSLDPQEQLSEGTLQLAHMVFDPLVRWTRDHGFEPRLAERWEQVSPTMLRLHLRTGVRFHSGNPFTAADVVFTFERLRSSPDFKALFAPFASMRAVDAHQIELVSHQPNPLALNLLTYLFPMDSAFYQGTDDKGRDRATIIKHGDSFASRNASGTGPFRVLERQQGVRVEFERFSEYWDIRSPGNLDRIVLTPIKEDPTRVAALLSGDIDAIHPVPPADLARLRQREDARVVTLTGTRIITLQLNSQQVPAFADPRVRQAVVLAINNQGIADKLMRGFATAAGQLSPPGYPGHDPALTPRYDPSRAKALMKEAGYKDGFRVSMLTPNNRYVYDEKIAQAVVSMLARIGIQVDLRTLPKAQYWPEYDRRAADILMIGWHADTEDSANFFEFLLMTPDRNAGFGQYNAAGYSNANLDALVREASTELRPGIRAQLLQRAERLVYEQAAIVPLHWQHIAWAVRPQVQIEPVLNVMNFPHLGDLVVQ